MEAGFAQRNFAQELVPFLDWSTSRHSMVSFIHLKLLRAGILLPRLLEDIILIAFHASIITLCVKVLFNWHSSS